MRAAEAFGCNTLQENNSTVAKLCNQSIPQFLVRLYKWNTAIVLEEWPFAMQCILSLFGFCGWWYMVGTYESYVDRKSADFVVHNQGHNKRSAAPPIQCTWSCALLDSRAKVHSAGDCLRVRVGAVSARTRHLQGWRQERESSLWGATGRWTGRRSPSTRS